MQIKLFTVPVLGGEAMTEELNRFLRAKKITGTQRQLCPSGAVALVLRWEDYAAPFFELYILVKYTPWLDLTF